jgi:hypothetical protein
VAKAPRADAEDQSCAEFLLAGRSVWESREGSRTGVTMTDHCYDLPGPRDRLVMATSDGWVPFDEDAATKLAESAMMLAFGAKHVDRLRRETQAFPASTA